MCKKWPRSKAQTTLEYAILIGVIVAALIAMQSYLKRGFQGKMRSHADSMGSQFSPGHTRVYSHKDEPPAITHEVSGLDGATNTSFENDHVRMKKADSYEVVSAFGDEEWLKKPIE